MKRTKALSLTFLCTCALSAVLISHSEENGLFADAKLLGNKLVSQISPYINPYYNSQSLPWVNNDDQSGYIPCSINSPCPSGYVCGANRLCVSAAQCGNQRLEYGEQCEVISGVARGCQEGYICDDCRCREAAQTCGNGRIDVGEECEANVQACTQGRSCESCKCVGDSIEGSRATLIDDGEVGFSREAGSFNTYQHASGFNGDFTAGKCVNREDLRASWNFAVSPSRYEVFVTYKESRIWSHEVPYTVYDGEKELGKVTLNHRSVPSDGEFSGALWESLGIYQVSGGSLHVAVGCPAPIPRQGVFIDAVRIEEVTSEDCAKEGDVVAVTPDMVQCCPGLRAISRNVPYGDKYKCVSYVGTVVCSDCGNGTCENWENICNCPDDCGEKEERCAGEGEKVFGNENFGPAVCCVKNSGIKPTAFESGDMCVTSNDGSRGTCVENWNRTCGNGICGEGEDRCNCPRDCIGYGSNGNEGGYCGDGNVDQGEQCDDGNRKPGDGCGSDCKNEYCGDGVVSQGEECDDSNASNGDGCNSSCRFEYCGDGQAQASLGEECDDGNVANGDGCDWDCKVEDDVACTDSDGGKNYFEEGVTSGLIDGEMGTRTDHCGEVNSELLAEFYCDGNNIAYVHDYKCPNGCSDGACKTETGPVCGNGIPEAGEECDDGNQIDDDTCNNNCGIVHGSGPECGNGVIENGENCDDGNENVGDGCGVDCTVEIGWNCAGEPSACGTVCGDGLVKGNEQCEENDDCGVGNVCNNVCQCEAPESECGNGTIEGAESCDDGNDSDGDGCDMDCYTEFGWQCSGEPSVCDTVCGDGVIKGSEQCDDGVNNSDTQPDACRTDCMQHTCGDGVVDSDEQCEDNEDCGTGKTCGGDCQCVSQGPLCGDGVTEGDEECDDGDGDNNDSCTNQCRRAKCGDGIHNLVNEQCDDGNRTNDDGCTNACRLPRCGDNVVQAAIGEKCDDGNTASGDGCSADCKQEGAAGVIVPPNLNLEWGEAANFLPGTDKIASFTTAVAHGKMYVLGGLINSKTISEDVYTSSDGLSWNKSAMKSPVYGHKSAAHNNGVWVVGGRLRSGRWTGATQYTTDGQNWNFGPQLPDTVQPYLGVLSFNGKLWLIGAVKLTQGTSVADWTWDSNAYARRVYVLDSPGANWREVGSDILPVKAGSSVVYQNKIWMFKDNQIFTSSDGQNWKPHAMLPLQLNGVQPFVHQGRLWVVGRTQGTPCYKKFLSTSDGISWQSTGSNLSCQTPLSFHMVLSHANRIWLLDANPFSNGRVFASPPLGGGGGGDYSDVREANDYLSHFSDRADLSKSSDGRYIAYVHNPGPGRDHILRRIDAHTFERVDLPGVITNVRVYGQPVCDSTCRYILAWEWNMYPGRGPIDGRLSIVDANNPSTSAFVTVWNDAPPGSTGTQQAISRDGQSVVFLSDRDIDSDPATTVGNSDRSMEVFLWRRSTRRITQITDLEPGMIASKPQFVGNSGRFVAWFGRYRSNQTSNFWKLHDMQTGEGHINLPTFAAVEAKVNTILANQNVSGGGSSGGGGNSSGRKCATYMRSSGSVELCATCGNKQCESGERCTPSSCSSTVCSQDCGSLYCPGDCGMAQAADSPNSSGVFNPLRLIRALLLNMFK